jgi:hypothetical protein
MEFTRTSNSPLSLEEVKQFAPSAFALAPHDSRSLAEAMEALKTGKGSIAPITIDAA